MPFHDRYIFVHLPKTAGTSLGHIIATTLGAGRVSEHITESQIDHVEARRLGGFDLVQGHISHADQQTWFPDHRVLTTLREPIDRCVSWIFYVRSLPPSPLSCEANERPVDQFIIENEVAQRNLFNRMTRQLGGHVLDDPLDFSVLLEAAKETLSLAFWIGWQDRLEKDINRLASLDSLLQNLKNQRLNVTPSRPNIADISVALRLQLQELNEYDIRLWKWAHEQFR